MMAQRRPTLLAAKARRRFAVAAAALLVVASLRGTPAVAASEMLAVMTFNLRYASDTPPDAWPARRPVMAECLRQVEPDVIGTQEGVYHQLQDLATDLPEYSWIGLGRDGGSRGEFMAVFYRTARLQPLAFDHFWLSDTPEVVGSKTWGNSFPRMVTWVHFRDRSSGGEFLLWNTHFDHQVQVAREKSAALLRARVAALNSSLPMLLIGDFNAAAGANPVHATLTDGGFFFDTWTAARERRGEDVGTFHDFGRLPRDGPRIDWILARGSIAVESVEIITHAQGGQYPSDHFPVVARVRLGMASR